MEQQSENKTKHLLEGFYDPVRLGGSVLYPLKTSEHARLWTPRARTTELGLGPNVRCWVRGAPACPTPGSARKDPRPPEKSCRCAKQMYLILVHMCGLDVVASSVFEFSTKHGGLKPLRLPSSRQMLKAARLNGLVAV